MPGAELEPCRLSGPETLLLRRASLWGPFGGARRIIIAATRIAIVNSGADACQIEMLSLDPLQRSGTGTIAESALQLASVENGKIVEPANHIALEIRGEAPARPGAYMTRARITTREGTSLTIPVSIQIPASPLWGIGCMLAGLLCLALLNFLAGESTLKSNLHDALAQRQAIHSWLEANPAPQSRAGDIDAMDKAFDAAIVVFGERRPIPVADHRSGEAAADLKTANAIADQLRRDLAGKPPGTAEIADLNHEWTDLKDIGQQIKIAGPVSADPVSMGPASTGPASAPVAPGLAGKLDAFLGRYRSRFLQQPIDWMSDEVASQLERIRLAYAAGEGDNARRLALTTRSWLRRSARSLNTALTGYRSALVQSGSMVAADNAIRGRVARPDVAPTDRAVILALLDNASARMDGPAWLPEWATAHHDINQAETELARRSAGASIIRFNAAVAVVNRQSDVSDTDQLVATLQSAPDHSPSAKRAGLTRVLGLWRAHIAQVDDAKIHQSLQNTLDALAPIVAGGDLKQVGPLYQTLENQWVLWSTHLLNGVKDRLDHQQCLDVYADLQRQTGAIEASLRERPAGPQSALWDRRLDQLHLDMQRRGPDADIVSADCMKPLLDLGNRTLVLSGEILTATIVDLEVPALTRLRLAQSSGLSAAVAATEASLEHDRSLDLIVATLESDRVVGRDLVFSIGGADPVWGSGVLIGIDFGDGSPPAIANAEQLRQDGRILHSYRHPITAHMAVVAAKEFKPGSIQPINQAFSEDKILGEGRTTILIAPSPVSRAQRLADELINLRFALALLIALTVYYWRYQNKTAIFGSKGFDYFEAFALGFAANAAIVKLPELLSLLPGV